jgi:hypothetical protein
LGAYCAHNRVHFLVPCTATVIISIIITTTSSSRCCCCCYWRWWCYCRIAKIKAPIIAAS